MNILVVDDDFVSRKLLSKFLLSHGEIDQAASGKEAVQAVQLALDEHSYYGLICLDIIMPGVDGFETLRLIRQEEQKAGLNAEQASKIVMTTSLSDKENVVKAAQLSCNGYLIKPLTKEKVLAQLEELGLLAKSD